MNRSHGVKRMLDVVLGSLLLVVFSPLMLAISVAILSVDGGPVLFRQVRPGLHGRAFTVLKFRTMRAPHEGENPWTTDGDRVSALGRFLRRTSLDELPELALVVLGRMSLVGPRPLLMEYLPKYNARHSRRHEMRPGLTGLAQVSGRRALTLSQRLDLDIVYIDKWSVGLDVRILARTVLEPFRTGDIRGQRIEEVDDLDFHLTSNGASR